MWKDPLRSRPQSSTTGSSGKSGQRASLPEGARQQSENVAPGTFRVQRGLQGNHAEGPSESLTRHLRSSTTHQMGFIASILRLYPRIYLVEMSFLMKITAVGSAAVTPFFVCAVETSGGRPLLEVQERLASILDGMSCTRRGSRGGHWAGPKASGRCVDCFGL